MVGQQDGEATVILSRTYGERRLNVRVTTDPSSPAVGVNIGAVDQTVTFPGGQTNVAVNVPILAGAPNPGEVDVNLDVTAIAPGVVTSAPLELQILASDATVPPMIISVDGKPHGIVLTFNKPMNPAGASNVKNYALDWTSTHSKYDDIGPFALLLPGSWPTGMSVTSGSARLRSAQYDPATRSVTLTTKGGLNYSAFTDLRVTSTAMPETATTNTTGPRRDQSNLGPGLTDLEGNPVVVHPGDPLKGFFSYTVVKGLQPAAS
jgi:hypothetical protein